MNRMTECTDGGTPFIPKEQLFEQKEGFTGPAAERLAAYENLRADILAEQERLSLELAELRGQDKQRSTRFREKMGQKLTNTAMLMLLDRHGL